MPVTATTEIVGLKETINALRKIDPQLQKDFKADATAIAQPAITAAKAAYTPVTTVAEWPTNGLIEAARYSRLLSQAHSQA
jgi:hypothetical protein